MITQNYPAFYQLNQHNNIPMNYPIVAQPQMILQPNQTNTSNDNIINELKRMQTEKELKDLKEKNNELQNKILLKEIKTLKKLQEEKSNQNLEMNRLNIQLNMMNQLKQNQYQNQPQNVINFIGLEPKNINIQSQNQLQPRKQQATQINERKPIVIVPSAGRPDNYRFKK